MISTKFNYKIPFYLLIASVCSLMLSLFLLQLFAGLISILWLIESFENKRKAIDIFFTLILIFGVVRILSILLSQFPAESVKSFYKDALFYLSFFSFSYYLKALGKERIKFITFIFIISGVVISLIGLTLFNLKLAERAQSFSSGYATFSSYLLAVLGVYIALPFNNKNKFNWLLWPLGISFILSGIITSMGRTNIAIAILLFIIGISFKKIKLKAAVLIFIFTAVFSLISFQNNKVEVKQRVEHPTVLSDRNILIKGAIDLAFDHPVFGFGPRTFHNIFPYTNELSDKGIGSWHNDFIQVYFESGILGLIAFLSIIFAFIFYSIKYLRKHKTSIESNEIVFGILLGFLGLVLSAITAGFIDSPVLSIVFAFLISLLSAIIFHSDYSVN
jgi:O-antigen ligase